MWDSEWLSGLGMSTTTQSKAWERAVDPERPSCNIACDFFWSATNTDTPIRDKLTQFVHDLSIKAFCIGEALELDSVKLLAIWEGHLKEPIPGVSHWVICSHWVLKWLVVRGRRGRGGGREGG